MTSQNTSEPALAAAPATPATTMTAANVAVCLTLSVLAGTVLQLAAGNTNLVALAIGVGLIAAAVVDVSRPLVRVWDRVRASA